MDVSLAIQGLEALVRARAVEEDVEPGRRVRRCSAEGLILDKAVAG